MTEKKARALHRAMWIWMMKHPLSFKRNWPYWKHRKNNEEIEKAFNANQCFACFFTLDNFNNVNCNFCPVAKKAGKCFFDENGIWEKYSQLMFEDRKKIEIDYQNFITKWVDVCKQMAWAWREIEK